MKVQDILNRLLIDFSRKQQTKSNHGFTIIELLVVVLIIAILTAIAAPSWNALTTRQRLRSVNNQVFQAIKTTQAEAKRTKEGRRIKFINDAGIPKVELYDVKGTFDDETDDRLIEKNSLTVEGQIKPDMLKIYTQASGQTADSISFNHLGVIPDGKEQNKVIASNPSQITDGFTVVTYLNDSKNSRKCSIVQTILGTVRIAEGTECPEPK